MRVLNVMLGAGRGGLEQAAVDYHEALTLTGCAVTTVIHPAAAVRPELSRLAGDIRTLRALGEWDPLAARRLRRIANEVKPSVMLCHGNRGVGLALNSVKGLIPIIGVANNYKLRKRYPSCDATFCVSRDLAEYLGRLGVPAHRIHQIPNIAHLPARSPRPLMRVPPVIGAMGRFVDKKGFDVLLAALALLRDRGIAFSARIAGSGPLEPALRRRIDELDLRSLVELPGWIDDKTAFFDGIDLFVLPSHHEPFGIVLIEAMARGLPAVTTDAEGPQEIVDHLHDGLVVRRNAPAELATAIEKLLVDRDFACRLGLSARRKVEVRYASDVVGRKLQEAIVAVAASTQHRSPARPALVARTGDHVG